MKSYIFLVFLLFSCSKELVLRPEVRGNVYNKDRIPVDGAEVTFIDCLNSDCNGEKPVYTNKEGKFEIRKEAMKYRLKKPHKYKRPHYSYTMIVKKKDYFTDTIDIREWKKVNNLLTIDSIILEK